MQSTTRLLTPEFLCHLLKELEIVLDPKALQSKLLKILADKHRLGLLRSTLSGTFRGRFITMALSDAIFAQMATTIAEFKCFLLHDDILALALSHEPAALEILSDAELYSQLTHEELCQILWQHPSTAYKIHEMMQAELNATLSPL